MRSEIKYLVPTTALPALRAQIAPFVEADPHVAGRAHAEYVVRSAYFDTYRLAFYHEKVEGLKNRRKLRIRVYDTAEPGSVAFLEIKRRHELRLTKDRAPVPLAALRPLLQTGDVAAYVRRSSAYPEALDHARHFFYHLRRYDLRPTILVVYHREPYVGRFEPSLRLTLDKRLRSYLSPTLDDLYRNGDLLPAQPRRAILEVKFFGRFPAWLRPIVAQFGLTQQSLSKYVICLDTYTLRARRRITVAPPIVQPAASLPPSLSA